MPLSEVAGDLDAPNVPPGVIVQGVSPASGGNAFGAPRAISANGSTYFVVDDHNPVGQSTQTGAFF